MEKTNKNTQDGENFHPMQNVHFRFIGFRQKIVYGEKDNNGYHE